MLRDKLHEPAGTIFKEITNLHSKDLLNQYLGQKSVAKTDEKRLVEYSNSYKSKKEEAEKHDNEKKRGNIPRSYEFLSRESVEKHLRKYFEYNFEYEEIGGEKVPKLGSKFELSFKLAADYPKLKVQTEQTYPEHFVAFYLLKEKAPTVAKVVLNWSKESSEKNPVSATLTQLAEPLAGNESIEFTNHGIPSLGGNGLLFVTFEASNKGKYKDLFHQCVIDLSAKDAVANNPIYGTFSAVRSGVYTTAIRPAAGSVVLFKAATAQQLEHDFEVAAAFIRSGFKDDAHKPAIENFLMAYSHLYNKLTITPENQPGKDSHAGKSSEIRDWKRIKDELRGWYTGEVFLHTPNDAFEKVTFLLEINILGHCVLAFHNRRRELKGMLGFDGGAITMRLYHQDRYIVLAIRDQLVDDQYSGTFYGNTDIKDDNQIFNQGHLILRKNASADNDEDHVVPVVSYEAQLETLTKQLKNHPNLLPDGQLLADLIAFQDPIPKNISLASLKLPEHFKYITFRIPDERRPPRVGIPSTAYRFEKCDLTFEDNFQTVSLRSNPIKFKGNVYFNGKVILMILNPVTESGANSNENFFTIQLDVSDIVEHKISGVDTIFGTSTWKSKKHLESKMVVLVKAESDDTESDVYTMGGFFTNPTKEELVKLNIEDKKYRGAFSYLSGRLNRHIHVSTGNGIKTILRPRDTQSREPYFHAALFLITHLNDSTKDIYKPKILTYLREAHMHQFASNYFAGNKLSTVRVDEMAPTIDPEVIERLRQILLEQQTLADEFSILNNLEKEVAETFKSLWPFLA
ncbi:hypothetical protein Dfer_1815 [Dyadobacter fermentans DSM 18053]|uniref:Uncharacterized protein n=2 Tax=Dyadobacter fermentans TaxID=94254 RepID=C6VUR7_DYAFD|nr:hypothetical protein Dfer_1815 [Dyadobacter fermentans DSM 18053]